ncbi:protein FAR1-RELATED SEQUENCE 6 [Medicago truncatula]|uniref:FAR1 domain-containing protein n=1 Tax=Medicago truncatula TaxID=3880 RepID=I3SSF9_MEDTR|nr:protein FAR1-RELATED SEQUENCE 6 [Medicago truncatula]AFK43201.1 unknown [Medicago truncatula]
MEIEIYDSGNGEALGNATIGEVGSSIANKEIVECSSFDPTDEQDQDDTMTQDSSGVDQIASAVPVTSVMRTIDEPYIGQEFVSEAEAHAFYNSYATRVGFVIRVSKLSRSRRDGSVIGRALVCNKEGFRMPDKREKIVRQRAETRVGCRAMIMVRKLNSGLWSITKFVKEHTHPLTPGRGRRDFVYEQYPSGHDRVRELTQQLAIEKKRAETYKRNLDLLYECIEEHNEAVSKKIQHIVESVKEMEAKEQESQFQLAVI